MIVLYIVILIYFNFNITSIVNVFMLSIEKKNVSLIFKFHGVNFESAYCVYNIFTKKVLPRYHVTSQQSTIKIWRLKKKRNK